MDAVMAAMAAAEAAPPVAETPAEMPEAEAPVAEEASDMDAVMAAMAAAEAETARAAHQRAAPTPATLTTSQDLLL